MNGTMPKFLEGEVLPRSYYESPNPYSAYEGRSVDLRKLSRYARIKGVRLVDLTKQDVEESQKLLA